MEVKKKLLDIVRDKIRVKHYSISTEKTYVHWVTHYILFHDKKHPKDMGKRDYREVFNTSRYGTESFSIYTKSGFFCDTVFI